MNEATTTTSGRLPDLPAGAAADAATAGTTRELERRVQRGRLSETLRDRAIAVLSPLVLLLIWEALSRSHTLDVRFFPAPSSIAGTFRDLIKDGSLWHDTTATLYRVGMGLLIGCGAGIVVGLVLGLIRLARIATIPILSVTMPIPKVALLPLLILIFGFGDRSKIAVVVSGVFFIMVYNTMAGVIAIPRIYMDVGNSFGASRLNFYRTVAIPGALPFMLTGLKLSYAVALLIVVPPEWSGTKHGLGYLVYHSWNNFAIPEMWVGIATLGVLGYVGGLLLEEVERLLVPWQR